MHHAAAEDFEPVAAGADLQLAAGARAADVDFGRGSVNGKCSAGSGPADRRGQKTRGRIRSGGPSEDHMGAAVDDEPLDLVEHRRMGRVMVCSERCGRGR